MDYARENPPALPTTKHNIGSARLFHIILILSVIPEGRRESPPPMGSMDVLLAGEARTRRGY